MSSFMNGHKHVEEGADRPDGIVKVMMLTEQHHYQVVVMIDDLSTGRQIITPGLFSTRDDMRLAYKFLEQCIDTMMFKYHPGHGEVFGHVVIMPFHKTSGPGMIIATEEFEFVSDAMVCIAMARGLMEEMELFMEVVVMMKGVIDASNL